MEKEAIEIIEIKESMEIKRLFYYVLSTRSQLNPIWESYVFDNRKSIEYNISIGRCVEGFEFKIFKFELPLI